MVSKFSDVAVGHWNEDKLGFKDYAEGIIAPMENMSKEDTPFTIGIFGSWGSGKTSFMQIMQELLESRGYETIFFKSWEYGNEEKPWIPFMIKIVDELFKKDKEEEIDKKELIRNIFLFSTDMVMQTYSQGRISTGGILDLIKKIRKTSPLTEWSAEDAKIVIERVTKIEEFKKRIKGKAEKSYLFSIDTPVLEKLFSYRKLTITKLNKYEENLNKGVISEKLKKKFKTKGFPLSDNATIKEDDDKWEITNGEKIYIVEKEDGTLNIYEKSKKGKIIIFIDDLDRIPEKIIDFLNSLKTFLDIRGCIFVLGCDYEILDSALKLRYKGAIYEDYFDKIVQTEFYIPKISEQAIKNYLQFLTDWSEEEIKECTQLVIHSIGGNPRKIKRVVNATMLIKSVFEKRLATSLQAFESPKPGTRIERMEEGKEERREIEEPMALRIKISSIFTPTEVFDLLFDKKVLFKLVCMREQWSDLYEWILSEEKKQSALISLQDADTTTDIQKYLSELLITTTKGPGYKLEEKVSTEKNLSIFVKDSPTFHGVRDLKTYLTLLEISSPEAGISMEYVEPEKLPTNLFNRYMIFERIDRGKVDERIIEKKINQMDWESNLSSYHFFIEVINAFGYDNLLKGLFEKNQMQIGEKIREDSTDLWAIGGLLNSVRGIDEETAGELLHETKATYAEKISASTDPGAIGWLLGSVKGIDEEAARELLTETKATYAEKISASTAPGAIGVLLGNVRLIDKRTAGELLNGTKATYAEKISASTDPRAIGWLLGSVREIDEEAARELLTETKATYAEKISASTDPGAIEGLLGRVREIDEKAARELLTETKATYAEKISASTGISVITWLLDSVKGIDEEAARELLTETKATYAEKIKASTDPRAIGGLLDSVRWIDEGTAGELLTETKATIAEKIKASTGPRAIGWLLDSVRLIEKGTAGELLTETKATIAEKIKASTDPRAIGWLLGSVGLIDEGTAKELLTETKATYAEKIKASTDPGAIGGLLNSVRWIDEGTVEWLEKETEFKSK